MRSLVELDKSGPVATVTLNRPDRHNSLVPDLLRELLDGIADADRDESVRVVVLAAAGKSFSTGGDVSAFFAAGDDLAAYASETVGLLNDVIMAMITIDKPIVTAVHGIVTGGSLGLLLGSDVVLMAPEASITPWYSVVGYSPDGGWTALLPAVIGRQRAAATLLGNETISAAEAVAWGLAAAIVPAEEIRAHAARLAAEIAELMPGALASTKRLLSIDHEAVAAALESELQAFIAQILTPEARRGMEVFLGVAK